MAAPQLTWANIIVTVGAFTAVASLGASVIQYQLAGLNEKIVKVDTDAIARDRDAKHDREGRDGEFNKKIDAIDAELLRRAELFFTGKEFREFKDAYLHDRATVEKRLDVIEATRPTAGTLEAVNKATEAQLGRFDERLRSLETAPRAPALLPGR